MQKTQFTVRQKALLTKQPRNGILPIKLFSEIPLPEDGQDIKKSKESIDSDVVLEAVTHLMQYLITDNKEDSFIMSLRGARNVNQELIAKNLIKSIEGIDKETCENTIATALQLSGYDNAYRNGRDAFKIPVQLIIPDEETFCVMKTMLKRCLTFETEFGPIAKFLVEFNGGYTQNIINGDVDFMTEDTLYLLNIDKKGPTKVDTLNLLICYLLSTRSKDEELFKNIKYIGFFNPKLNCIYKMAVSDIDDSTLTIAKELI